MDPASLAIGVVPLAFNIVQLSSAVREKITTYKSAPADILNILEKTQLISQICARLEVDLKSPNPRHEVVIIEQALRKCHSSVLAVHNDLQKAASDKNDRKRAMRFIFNKFHIDRSLSDLNDSIAMLNTCITMSTCLSLNTLQLGNPTDETKRTKTPISCPEPPVLSTQRASTSSLVYRRRKWATQVETRKTSHSSSWLLLENTATNLTGENSHEQSTYRSYLVGSPLFNTFITLAIRYGPLNPFTLALDTPQFVFERHDKSLFDAIIRCAPGKGAPSQAVAQWVDRFGVKPSMQLIENHSNDRTSILGMLMACNKHISRGLPWAKGGSKGRHELSQLYIDIRGPLFTLEEYGELLIPSLDPTVLIEMFHFCKGAFDDQTEDFVYLTMRVLEAKFLFSYKRFQAPTWASAVTELLAAGLELHDNSDLPGLTILSSFLTDEFRTEMDILECAETWIEVLSHAAIDVDEYLYVELFIFLENLAFVPEPPEEWFTTELEPWHSMSVRARLEVMFDILNPGLRVPYAVDANARCDLLQIMPALRYDEITSLSVRQTETPSHLDWKRSRITDGCKYRQSWPFLQTVDSVYCSSRDLKNLSEETKVALASHDRYLQLMTERFERRQQIKWEKLRARAGTDEARRAMPGGWETEWWEYQGGW